MKTEEFIERWARNEETVEAMNDELDLVITEAIVEHEQNEWLPYPENKPNHDGTLLVTIKVNDKGNTDHLLVLPAFWDYNEWKYYDVNEWDAEIIESTVIAFRELPSPYREKGGEG